MVGQPKKVKRNPKREAFLKKTYPKITFNFKKYPLYGITEKSVGRESTYNTVTERAKRWDDPSRVTKYREKELKWKKKTIKEEGLPAGQQKRLSAIKAGIIYAKNLEDILSKKEGLGLSTGD